MAEVARYIAEMVEMLPEQEQIFQGTNIYVDLA